VSISAIPPGANRNDVTQLLPLADAIAPIRVVWRTAPEAQSHLRRFEATYGAVFLKRSVSQNPLIDTPRWKVFAVIRYSVDQTPERDHQLHTAFDQGTFRFDSEGDTA
jgi:hypothetical protein